jgi:hypothetical protein
VRRARDIDVEELKIIVIFCSAGLLLSLVAAVTYGLNLAADLFWMPRGHRCTDHDPLDHAELR